MSAGIQPTPASVNQSAGNMSVQLRELFAQVKDFNAWLNAIGGTTFLTATLGMPSPDANTIVSTFGNLDALRAIYEGGTPGAAFNYRTNSNSLWGGI
jgi:hypothetical protein